MLKLVPYISFPYAEHALRMNGAQPNAVAEEKDAEVLALSAMTCRNLVEEIDKCETGIVKGFVIYTPDPNYKPEEEEKKEEEGEEEKEKPKIMTTDD